MKTRINSVLFTLLIAGAIIAAQSCKLLFKSEYSDLKAEDLAAFVEARYPDMQKRQLAQNQQIRKQVIDNFKKAFSFAQAAEEEGLHKTENFRKQLDFGMEQLLASKYTELNPEVIVSKEDWEAYYASHKPQFETHIGFLNANRKQPISDEQKEQRRAFWSEVMVRAEKARQAGVDKDPGVKVMMKFGKADLLANLYAKSLEEKNKLTDAEKKKFLAENPGADPEKLKEKAQGLLDRVKNGESFEKIADEFNEDGTKGRGGDLDWFSKGKMDPVFEAAAFALQKGQTSSELVKSNFGYHIIRVDDRRMAPPAPAQNPADPKSTPDPNQAPQEEIHARHIYVDTRVSETYETQTIQEKVKRLLEDATLKFPVNAPADFVVNVAGLDRNRIPGVGAGGQMRRINPEENK